MELPKLTASLTLEDPSGMEPVAWTPRGEHEVRFACAEKRTAVDQTVGERERGGWPSGA